MVPTKFSNPFLLQLTRVTNELTFTTEAVPGDGFPTKVDLIYSSDFGNPGLVDPGAGNAGLFLEAKILAASTGAARYVATDTLLTIAVGSTTAFNVDLNRNADPDPPAVGTYNVQLDVALKYRNSDDTVWVMDNVVYTISITVTGADASTTVDTAAGDAATVFGGIDSTTAATANGQAGTRAKAPPSLKVAQSAGGTSAGDSVTLTLSMDATDDGKYYLWVPNANTITFCESADFASSSTYEWPDARVASTVTAKATDITLNIVLTAVPKEVYDWGTGTTPVYVKVAVEYFQHTADAVRRNLALRALQVTDGAPNEDGSANVVAEVYFGSDDSGATIITSFTIVSATALSGAALFL